MNRLASTLWILMMIAGYIAVFYLNTKILFYHTTWAQEVQNISVINAVPISAGEGLSPILEKINKEKMPQENILFVGDIMLDRGVETLIQKYGYDYPFEKIIDFLDKFNLVSANLEGPIVTQTKDFGPHALQFAFASDSAGALLRNRINLVSLANNHTLNMGQAGLSQTRQYLEAQGIGFAGDPLKCGFDLAYQENNLLFLAFNPSFSSGCTNDEYIATVTRVRTVNPDKFLIINIHWGVEYQTINSKTQSILAHKLIDAGADLIIGHHPHVVENIEIYKNKLIFYSFGNFIFDQYFNENVQKGLTVNLQIYKEKYLYVLYPINIKKSQPELMQSEAKSSFLENLAKYSSAQLQETIKSGQIEIKNKYVKISNR